MGGGGGSEGKGKGPILKTFTNYTIIMTNNNDKIRIL